MEERKVNYFTDMYRQARHKVSKLVHTAKCKFCTERIALASSSNELYQIVNTLSNRHPPKILPNIYPSADLSSLFISHFNDKVEKVRANIASEPVTSTLSLVTVATTAAFLHLKQRHNHESMNALLFLLLSHVTLISSIPNLIECLDTIVPSLTDLFNSYLASSHNASNQLLSHLLSY